jgi:hypothetical protein
MSEYAISQSAQSQQQVPSKTKSISRPASAVQLGKDKPPSARPASAKVSFNNEFKPMLIATELDKSKTHPFFKESKVAACAHVVVQGGVPKVAIALSPS